MPDLFAGKERDRTRTPVSYRAKNPLVKFTPEKLARLKKSFTEAKESGKETFVFENNELITEYVGYMIRWLEAAFKYRD